jgi:hypothetical protein
LRSIVRIWETVFIDGDSPPWTQKTRSSTIAESARKSKMSVHHRQTFGEPYLKVKERERDERETRRAVPNKRA